MPVPVVIPVPAVVAIVFPVRVDLPEDFQKSEFLLEHGAIDMIVHRKDLRQKLASLLSKLYPET